MKTLILSSALLSWLFSGLLVIPALSQEGALTQTEAKNPSYFSQDKEGVLWFVKGKGDGENNQSAALDLSAVTDGIVISVVSDNVNLDKAVGLALKMGGALKKNPHAPEHVYVVAFETSKRGVGYRFYTDGIAAGGKEGGNSTYGPKDAKTKLGDVLDWWIVLRDMAKKGEWGTDHDKIIPLVIRKK